jgi:hypothetical protein
MSVLLGRHGSAVAIVAGLSFGCAMFPLLGASGESAAGQTQLEYMLSEQAKLEVSAGQLTDQMTELRNKLAVDPNKDLRAKIERADAVVKKLHGLPEEASEFVNPWLIPTFDWSAHDVAAKAAALRRELAARVKAPSPEWQALGHQIEVKQAEMERNANLLKTVRGVIADLQADHRRESSIAEYDELANRAGNSVITPLTPGSDKPTTNAPAAEEQ